MDEDKVGDEEKCLTSLKMVLKRRTMLLIQMMEFQEPFEVFKASVTTCHKGYCTETEKDVEDADRHEGSTVLGPGDKYSYKAYNEKLYSDGTDFEEIEDQFELMMMESQMRWNSIMKHQGYEAEMKSEDYFDKKYKAMVCNDPHSLKKIFAGKYIEATPKYKPDAKINEDKKPAAKTKKPAGKTKKPSAKTKKPVAKKADKK